MGKPIRKHLHCGYVSTRNVYREEFQQRKIELEKARKIDSRKRPNRLASAGLLQALSSKANQGGARADPFDTCNAADDSKSDTVENYPMLIELAKREESVRSGRLSTVIFIRTRNTAEQEVSG